jgi:hypothetical protein
MITELTEQGSHHSETNSSPTTSHGTPRRL